MTDWRVRYGRHLSLAEIGEAGHQRLRMAEVLIVGAGGLGVPAATYLAGAGVGTLWLNDFDTVDVSNLHRQTLYTLTDIGQRKAAAAARHLAQLNPDVILRPVTERLDVERLAEIAGQCTVVLDCSDNFPTRFAVNQACLAARRPLVSGAAIRMEGQLAVFRNDLDRAACYRCLYDEDGEELENCSGAGILGPVAGVIGSLMAVEAIKLITGAGASAGDRLLLYDGRDGDWRSLGLRRDPACPACARFRSR
jgi:adenylyltransferase/sulfurtransferase